MKLILSYAGRRLSKNDTILYHYLDDSNKEYCFKHKLSSTDAIGCNVEVEKVSDTKYKYIKTIGLASKEHITSWSVQDRHAIEEKETIAAIKVKPNNHVDKLIDAVKGSCNGFSQRKRLALYIYYKLLQ